MSEAADKAKKNYETDEAAFLLTHAKEWHDMADLYRNAIQKAFYMGFCRGMERGREMTMDIVSASMGLEPKEDDGE